MTLWGLILYVKNLKLLFLIKNRLNVTIYVEPLNIFPTLKSGELNLSITSVPNFYCMYFLDFIECRLCRWLAAFSSYIVTMILDLFILYGICWKGKIAYTLLILTLMDAPFLLLLWSCWRLTWKFWGLLVWSEQRAPLTCYYLTMFAFISNCMASNISKAYHKFFPHCKKLLVVCLSCTNSGVF